MGLTLLEEVVIMAPGQSGAVLSPPLAFHELDAVSDLSDGELLTRFVAIRDELAEIAFGVVVRRHGPMVLRVCQQVLGDRHTAEDAFQATFLILARKAGSLRRPELLGNWLHGVALRTAREARMRDVRRRRREAIRARDDGGEPIDETGQPELPVISREEYEALHDEVSRLPERYRVPVVLCDLEGLTHNEAARRMRCPVGTISVRLSRARDRLRDRLTRRGVAPTAGLLSALLCTDADSVCASSALMASTASAAMHFVAGNAAAGGVASMPAVSLSEAILRGMALARLKSIIGVSLTIGVATALSWIVMHRAARINVPAAKQAAQIVAVAPLEAIAAGAPKNNDRPTAEKPPAARSASSAPAVMANIAPSEVGSQAPAKPDIFAVPSGKKDADAKSVRDRKPGADVAAVPPKTPRPPRDDEAWGAMLFAKEWAPDDPMSHAGDGLGPVYNDTSCVACHSLGAPGGAGPESKNVVIMTALPGCGPTNTLELIHPGFRGSRSTVLHHYGTDSEYASWRRRIATPEKNRASKASGDPVQARIREIKARVSPENRIRERSRESTSLNGVNLSLAERNTPALFGVGQIDEIPPEVLLAVAANQPERVRGRVGRTADGRIGRFGWKAQISSLHEFVRAACANELGLEVPGHSQVASPLVPGRKADGLDLTERDCDALVSYVRALPPPVVIDPFGPQGTVAMRDGRRLFDDVGCASCHVASLGDVRGIYSDLLLHNMGQSLSDSGSTYGGAVPDGPSAPTAREWRTPPLWGFRDSGPYMHDGRAQNLEEAVALHDGQGRKAAQRYFALSSQDWMAVEAFLKSLVAPTAAAAPGIMLAADMERRINPENERLPERVVRRRKENAAPRDEKEWRQIQRRRLALEAAKRARVQIPIAESLEKMGKTEGALNFYRDIARQAAGTDEGRHAAERIEVLSTRIVSP
jgi:RNA polymerase sigma factor (sigma-70 family)